MKKIKMKLETLITMILVVSMISCVAMEAHTIGKIMNQVHADSVEEKANVNKEDVYKKEIDEDLAKEIYEQLDYSYPSKLKNVHPSVQTKIESKKAQEEREKYWITHVRLTSYCGCYICSEEWGTQKSTGGYCKEGRTIAVDPTIIPYGSIVEIDGHKYVAEDCGGGVKGHHIDIYTEHHSDTYNPLYNRKNVEIKVYYK